MLTRDVAQDDASLLQVLSSLPHDYTVMNRSDWRWGNMVTALLVPQRSLMLGLPLAILTLTLLWRDLTNSSDDRQSPPAGGRRIVAAGILTAMLPLVHAHTYAVIVGMAGCLALLFRRVRPWMPFFLISVPLGIAQVLWIAADSPIRAEPFLDWQVGWDRGSQNPFWFWLKNTGAAIPLIIVAMCWRGQHAPVPQRLLLFYLPFTLCFLVPNVVRLAPWIWDNIKVLIYWHIASAPIIALVLVRLWRQRGVAQMGAILLTISLTLAGALDIWRVMSRATNLRIFSRDGISFAELVGRNVPSTSIIVHAPTYNHPVFLSGRRSFMGYPGHVSSHGIPDAQREAEIRQIYSGAADAEAVLARHRIGYLVLGPIERADLKVNELFLARYPKVAEVGAYTLLQVVNHSR